MYWFNDMQGTSVKHLNSINSIQGYNSPMWWVLVLGATLQKGWGTYSKSFNNEWGSQGQNPSISLVASSQKLFYQSNYLIIYWSIQNNKLKI